MTVTDLDQLSLYYQKHFPFALLDQWFGKRLDHMEFSFTFLIQNQQVYNRFQSFDSIQQLQHIMVSKTPIKMDIGACYNVKPCLKKTIESCTFVPLSREFVLDIDLTDYDPIRSCCQGTTVCGVCWGFITVAIQILHQLLVSDLGLKHIVWVFSGRRGVHCWVSDETVRVATTEERRAMVQYLQYKSEKRIHPSVDRAFGICSSFFYSVLLQQMDLLAKEEAVKVLLHCVDDAVLRSKLEQDMKRESTSVDKWKVVKRMVKQSVLIDIVYTFTWPRLDSNVSIGLNHLLKSPFSIHPSTGVVVLTRSVLCSH
jgi:DNA primase small subunit